MSAALFLNQKAGALQPGGGEEHVASLLRELEIDARVVATRSAGEMRERIQREVEAGALQIAVAGGDGTVGLAAQVLAGTSCALAIVPQGTFNNFATALRLPQDLPSALLALREAEVRAVDIGWVHAQKATPRLFLESAGVGLFADALALYGASSNKNLARGLYALARVLGSLRAGRVKLHVDGRKVEVRALQVLVCNTYRMAQAIPYAPGARVTDGLLDIVVCGDIRRGELLPYYRAIRAQLHGSLPKVRLMQGHDIRIQTRSPRNVHADDSAIGTTPAAVRVRPGALQVLVPRL
jgi:diacylglycerol kinase (ATP)